MKTTLIILASLMLAACGKEGTPAITVVPLVCASDEVKVTEDSGWGAKCVPANPPKMVCTGSGWDRRCEEIHE